jgi:hypothetical protein
MSDIQVRHTEQQIYWNQLVLIKIVSCYVKRYRDEQSWWITRVGGFKAVVSSSTIGAWAIWKDYAIVWGGLIALVQVIDALKDYIPQAKHTKAASDFVAALEEIINDARLEWHGVFNGKFDADDIMTRWRKLAGALSAAEHKHFPDGIPPNEKRQTLAESDAKAYFLAMYGVGGENHA